VTTGSWSRGDPTLPTTPGGFYWAKSWTGADRTPLPKPPLEVTEVCTNERRWVAPRKRCRYNRHGKMVCRTKPGYWKSYKRCRKQIMRPASGGPTGTWRPPKRAYDVPHAYSMSERYAREYATTLVIKTCPGPGCSPAVSTQPGVLFRDLGYPSWIASTLITANDKLKLINKLREKINGSDFNLAVMLAETLESCDMISATAKKLARAYAFARQGRWVQAARTLSDGPVPQRIRSARERDPISGHWLELQYGWLPLLNDVKGAAELLAHQLNVPFRKRYHVQRRIELTSEQKASRSIQSYCCPITNSFVQASSASTKTQLYAITAYVTEAQTIPQLLGLTNPASVLWEKLPYSFVADWFMPIGQWLEARGFASDLVGTFVVSDLRKGIRHVPDLSQYMGTINPGQGNPLPWTDISFTRSVSTSLSTFVPLPEFQPLNKVLTWKHAANAVALLVSRYGSSSTRKLFRD